MASLFGITPADLQAKLVPASAEGSFVSFSIGDGGSDDLSSAGALAIVETQEAIVESYLRPKYQTLLRRVPGEIAARFAEAGQTTVQATLRPVTTVHVYKNFPRTRAWPDRRPAERMSASEYTVNPTTGLVTFAVALRENDEIVLDYWHTGAGLLLDLKHLVLSLAAVEVSRRFAYFKTADGFERFEGWQSSAAGHLRDLGRAEGAQIGLLDRIELKNETRELSYGDL